MPAWLCCCSLPITQEYVMSVAKITGNEKTDMLLGITMLSY